MSRSLYWKITLPLVVLVLGGMAILGLFTVNTAKTNEIEQLRVHMVREARLIAVASFPYFTGENRDADLDSLAKDAGTSTETRVTIIAPDGTVLGDTVENPAVMENHAARPEVMDALATGIGESTRFSTTTGRTTMYVAVPVVVEGSLLGVARVALPLDAVEASSRRMVVRIVWATAVAALLVALTSALIARMITRPVRQLTVAARVMATGHLDQQIVVRTRDEIGRLGRAFNDMSSSLKRIMSTVSDERSKLATVVASIPSGIVMTDLEKRVVLANAAAGGLYGFGEAEAPGRSMIEVVHDHEIEALLVHCLETGRMQSTQVDSTGGRFLRAIAVPLMAERVTGALVIFQDLTEMRNLQITRQEFVGNISHELKTPLAAIKAIVETLQDGALYDESVAGDFLSKVGAEVDGMTQMVDELIELSRVESGRAKFNLVEGDLNDVAREVVARLTPQAERSGIVLSTSLSAGLHRALLDRDRIHQALANVVHNAIKFTPAGGSVTVSSKLDSDSVTISVVDTGVGISKQDLPHVFERFFKADRSRSSGGSGLGLAVAKHIVNAHKGEISVRSEEGKGSAFTFRLPLKGARE